MQIADQAASRLASSPILPEMQAVLLQWVAEDAPGATGVPQWDRVIPTLYRLLDGADEASIQPFVAAWGMLTAAVRRLDHLQDGDLPASAPGTIQELNTHYTMLLGYYLLATALLDDLDDQVIPGHRLVRLRRLWNDCLLRAASGQQLDLVSPRADTHGVEALSHYQRIAEAKSGAIFMLAFGGSAMLATDDPDTIAALSFAGDVYGTLLQFNDDVLDATTQPNQVLTLPRAYHAACTAAGLQLPAHDVTSYWQYIYAAYIDQVKHAVHRLPPNVQQGVHQLFTATFNHHITSEAS